MANKQMSGYGFGVSNTRNSEVKNSPIQNAEQKTQELINQNPNGTTITKLSAGINNQLTSYLPIVKNRIAELEKIKALGSSAEGYNEAVEEINKQEQNLMQLNSDLEQAAALRKQALDTQVNENYSISNTDEQATNFHNLANGTFSDEATIEEDESGTPRLMYGGIPYNEVDTGGSYSVDLEELVDAELANTLDLAHGQSAISIDEYNKINRPNLKKNLEKLIKDSGGKTAVKDYMYQNPELIDMFISNQTGKQVTPEYKETDEYKKLYNLNKTGVDFNDGFVDLVLGMHDAEFQKKEETKSPLAQDLIAKYSK